MAPKEDKSLRPFSATNGQDNIIDNSHQSKVINKEIDPSNINSPKKLLNLKGKANCHSKSTISIKKPEKKNKEVKKLNIISILPFGLPKKRLNDINNSNRYMYNRIIDDNIDRLKKVFLQKLA